MSNTLWLTDTMRASKDDTELHFKYEVDVYLFPDSAWEHYENVIDIVFNDGIIVLVLEDGCVYYRAKHVKKWTAQLKE